MRLVDAHAHVQADRFAGDLSDVLLAAAAAGVERLLVPGWNLASSRGAVALAHAPAPGAPSIDAAVGIHPHEAAGAGPGREEVAELAADPAVVAIGETGLDYDRAFSPREDQLVNLRWHLALGRRTGKPVILHCRSAPGLRDAQDDLVAELRAAGAGDAAWRERLGCAPPAILHSFSGPVDFAEAALELGLAIGFSGLVFRRGEEPSAQVARIVPPHRLLVETDSPYLSPPGAPKRRNEPSWVAVTARWVAAQRDVEPDALGEALVPAYDAAFRTRTGEQWT